MRQRIRTKRFCYKSYTSCGQSLVPCTLQAQKAYAICDRFKGIVTEEHFFPFSPLTLREIFIVKQIANTVGSQLNRDSTKMFLFVFLF
jgi:hypothetical protein